MQKNSLFDILDLEAGFTDFGTAHNRVMVSFSGGKDSVATLMACLEQYPKHIVEAIFCDTGDEAPETYEYIQYFHENIHPVTRLATRLLDNDGGKTRKFESVKIPIDMPAETVRRDYHTVYDEIIDYYHRIKSIHPKLKSNFSPYPSIHNRHCTRTLKTQTFGRYLTSIVSLENRSLTVHCLGIRRGESTNRSKQQMFAYNPDNGVDLWYPIANYTIHDVWAMHDKYGVKRNAVYENDKRSNCIGCVFAGVDSIRNAIDKHGSEIVDGWVRVEEETGYKMWGHIGINDIVDGSTYDFETNPLFSCASGFCDVA